MPSFCPTFFEPRTTLILSFRFGSAHSPPNKRRLLTSSSFFLFSFQLLLFQTNLDEERGCVRGRGERRPRETR